MFIGRDRELAALNKLYKSDKFEFCVIYGRRRVGKTALISEFIKNKRAIYFTSIESNAKQNLENLSGCIMEDDSSMQVEASFSSFQAAFEYVFKLATDTRLILVIDEYPYLARACESLASTLQMLIDKHKHNSKLMLVLCGSSMSYMEDEVLAYKAPLYGRRTAQFKILPFEFAEVCHYLYNFNYQDRALLYGAIGGTPQYLLQIDQNVSVAENIKEIFLNSNSSLFEEPENLLKQEMREPALYNTIILAIANGASKLSEISTKVGETTATCSVYLRNLILLGLVKKENPYGETATRKTIYLIEDNMFRFWYRFVLNNKSLIARGAADLVFKRIEPYFSEYMGPIFEQICQQYLWYLLLQGRLDIEFTELGRWWGNDPVAKKQTEIDIMGVQDKSKALFAECKWINDKVDQEVLETLVKRSHLFNYAQAQLFLFSKSGFTQKCVELAKQLGNVSLVTFDDIAKEFAK